MEDVFDHTRHHILDGLQLRFRRVLFEGMNGGTVEKGEMQKVTGMVIVCQNSPTLYHKDLIDSDIVQSFGDVRDESLQETHRGVRFCVGDSLRSTPTHYVGSSHNPLSFSRAEADDTGKRSS